MSSSETNSEGGAPRPVAVALFTLLRPHQWIKNGFVAAPLLFTPAAVSVSSVATVAAGFASFCLLSSAAYVINDYIDREADRQHPEKRDRPLAAGKISTAQAAGVLAVLIVVGFSVAATLGPPFLWFVAGYVALNLAYSLKLRQVEILDVLIIAIGFVLRVYSGAVLIEVVPSAWILICTGLLGLFLALAKRRDDLERQLGTDHRASLKGYSKEFLDTAITVVLAALLVAYMIYTTDSQVIARLGTSQIYLTTPFVVAGVLRYLQITLVEKRSGSPTRLLFQDQFLRLTILGWLLTFGLVIYT